MNATGKLIFALVLVTGFAATGAAVAVHGQADNTATIQLPPVIVTPDSASVTIELAAVHVMPTAADWQYARAHKATTPVASLGPAPKTINLAAVTVVPTEADWTYVRAQQAGEAVASRASANETIELAAVKVVPTTADWAYARAQRASQPTAEVSSAEATIELAAVQVTPSADDWQYVNSQAMGLAATSTTPTDAVSSLSEAGVATLMQAVSSFAPGRMLDSQAVLHALAALAFGGNGR